MLDEILGAFAKLNPTSHLDRLPLMDLHENTGWTQLILSIGQLPEPVNVLVDKAQRTLTNVTQWPETADDDAFHLPQISNSVDVRLVCRNQNDHLHGLVRERGIAHVDVGMAKS
jgi:hypothetical protein